MTLEIAIESGIPIPDPGRGAPYKYPWRQMKIGDSFIFPGKTLRAAQGCANRATAHRKTHHGEAYKTRTVTENGVRVVRVWRVA